MTASAQSNNELDRFLNSPAMPQQSLKPASLDGFLAALALTPDPVANDEWLPWVWDMDQGTERPVFADAEQEQRLAQQILGRFTAVSGDIKRQQFAPYKPGPDSDPIQAAEAWCEGFVLGMTLSPAPWDKLLDRHSEMLSPMMLLGTERGRKTVAQSRETTFAAIAEAIPASVAALKAYFVSQTGPVRIDAKVGRNDPCPCGSGKKFKKCCG